MNNIYAIDVGFGRVKAIRGAKRVEFSSLIADYRPIRFLSGMERGSAVDNLCVEYKGRSYFVGEIARRQSTPRATMRSDRCIQTEGMVLTLTALALLSRNSGEEVNLVTGLPVSEYTGLREEYRSKLLGSHSIRMLQPDGKWGVDYDVNITDVRVIPQPIGTIFWSVLDEDGQLKPNGCAANNLAVIDIGQHTVDLARMDSLEFIDRESTSFNDIGIFQVYRDLAQELCRIHKIQVQSEEMESLIRQGSLKIGGLVNSIHLEKELVFRAAAEKIASRARNLWRDLWRMDKVFLTGGGSLLLGDYLIRELGPEVPVECCTNPIYTNSDGYLRYAKRARA